MTNTAPTTGVVKGKNSQDKPEDPVCKELADAVKDRRENAITPGIEAEPHTIGAGKVIGKDAEPKVALSYISKLGKRSFKRSRFIEPMTFKEMLKPFSQLFNFKKQPLSLCGQDYKFPWAGSSSLGTHAEARIIAQAAKAGYLGGGDLFLSVDWRNTTGKSKAPCIQCQELICDTMDACKTNIFMCDKDNQPVDMKDYCDKNADEKTQGKLRTKLEDKLNVDMVKKAAAKAKRAISTRG